MSFQCHIRFNRDLIGKEFRYLTGKEFRNTHALAFILRGNLMPRQIQSRILLCVITGTRTRPRSYCVSIQLHIRFFITPHQIFHQSDNSMPHQIQPRIMFCATVIARVNSLFQCSGSGCGDSTHAPAFIRVNSMPRQIQSRILLCAITKTRTRPPLSCVPIR